MKIFDTVMRLRWNIRNFLVEKHVEYFFDPILYNWFRFYEFIDKLRKHYAVLINHFLVIRIWQLIILKGILSDNFAIYCLFWGWQLYMYNELLQFRQIIAQPIPLVVNIIIEKLCSLISIWTWKSINKNVDNLKITFVYVIKYFV